jgi:hypothetical protein
LKESEYRRSDHGAPTTTNAKLDFFLHRLHVSLPSVIDLELLLVAQEYGQDLLVCALGTRSAPHASAEEREYAKEREHTPECYL